MNENSENQFKKFLIIIVLVSAAIIYFIVKPDFLNSVNNKNGLKLSSQKPWQEEFAEDKDEIDDVDIQLTYTENRFKNEEEEEKEKSFFDMSEKYNEDYWVTGNIPINPMSDFNNKTRNDIYKIRKNFVDESMFKNKKYRPSDEVFGQIADNKPWISIDALTCYGKGPNAHKGLSEESRYINNPTMLIGLDRVSFDDKPKSQCSVVDYLMPVKINYSKDENMLKVLFEVSKYRGDLGMEFLLKGLNAKDLGFKYAYADKTENIVFLQQDTNISKDIQSFKDFIHLGTVCGVKGGCNNGSPFQKELNYTVMRYPASIHFKLWKKKPKNKDSKEDINYLIILK